MSKTHYLCFIALCCVIVLVFAGCVNPFAPAKVDSDPNIVLGDPTTIDGFFQSFAYSYNMKDTVVYGSLLAEGFIFAYRNYDLGMDFSWTREEDMLTTYRLFNAAQTLDFVWNEIVMQSGNDTSQVISRSFDLTINFDNTEPDRFSGRAYFILKRQNAKDNWMLSYWRDDSYY